MKSELLIQTEALAKDLIDAQEYDKATDVLYKLQCWLKEEKGEK